MHIMRPQKVINPIKHLGISPFTVQMAKPDSLPFRSMTWDSGGTYRASWHQPKMVPNLYLYISNSPLGDTDPSGLMSAAAACSIVGVVGGILTIAGCLALCNDILPGAGFLVCRGICGVAGGVVGYGLTTICNALFPPPLPAPRPPRPGYGPPPEPGIIPISCPGQTQENNRTM